MARRRGSRGMVPVAVIAAALLTGGSQPAPRRVPLAAASIADIQRAVDAGTLTYEALIAQYLRRIEAYDRRGPRLNAVLQVQPRALEMARALDEERRTTGRRSAVHGIPIAVKDTVDVRDLPSAGGNLALAGAYPARDATVVDRLRRAGAIIFLKTNLDEFNLGAQGLSSLGGQVLNPYDLTRNPGGSSAGTGVAITAGFATAGIATETGASIRSPASNSSVVGVAPTSGLTSRAGVLPSSFTLDRVGVHAKTVADAAILLSIMRGFDAEDLMTSESLGHVPRAPYETDLVQATLSGVRLGVFRDLFRRGAEFEPVNALIRSEVARMAAQGAIVVEDVTTGTDLVASFPGLRFSGPEFRFGLEAYLARRGPDSPVKTLADLVATGQYLRENEQALKQALAAGPLDHDEAYLTRLGRRPRLRQDLIALMDRHRVDALVHPFKSLGAPPLGTADRGPRDNPVSAISGLPAIVVPAGVDAQGLPVAIEFLGRPFSEHRLFAIAHAYEQASHRRSVPATTPPLDGEGLSLPR